MRIAVDVMGGDHGCGVVIAGAKLALQANKQISALFLSAIRLQFMRRCHRAVFAIIAFVSSIQAK